MSEQEILYTMALTRVPCLNLLNLRTLYDEFGSSTAIYENRNDLKKVLPAARKNTLDALAGMDAYLKRAEEEMAFAEAGKIKCLTLGDTDYPERLRECPDAPLLLYFRGSANLNTSHIISMVGTRKITEYGKDICAQFVKELKRLLPDALIVSGLAYGIDVHCHRAALNEGMDTVGVLAHGLDQIYPRMHRNTAIEMLSHGGLLTEFMSQTNADKKNFVQRNRIVAGLADATIVVQSAARGGSLITAEIADGYGRDVFAVPGRVTDEFSVGCNMLIAQNKAGLITCAEDFVKAMGWEYEQQRSTQLSNGIQQELFPDLSDKEQLVVKSLQGVDNKQVNIISVETNIPIGQLTSILFNLEMKGVVKLMSGGMYRLLG